MKGILLVDKPAGITSHDVVDKIRKAAGMRRVGHTGTLDPGATGLLILCLGWATRLADFFVDQEKTYEGVLRLGVTTDSYDMDGRVVEEKQVPDLNEDDIRAVFARLTGDIEQLPPMISAVKVGGKRLYKLARQGETVERQPRPVKVYEFSLLSYTAPDAAFRVRCSRGTYARALCHDAGALLGCGGMLAALRRTQVGPHRVADAAPVDAFRTPEDVTSRLMPIEKALDMPVVSVRGFSRKTALSGGALTRQDIMADCPVSEGWVQVTAENGALLALAEVSQVGSSVRIQPRKVFAG